MCDDEIVYCCYCGRQLRWIESSNPFDDGLHDMRGKYNNDSSKDQVCCATCNGIITWSNRMFRRIVKEPWDYDLAVFELEETVKKLKTRRNEIQRYYLGYDNSKRNSEEYH